MNIDFMDCPEIKDKLTDEERKVYDDVLNVFKHNALPIKSAKYNFCNNTAICMLYIVASMGSRITYRNKACNTCSKTYSYSVCYH